MVGKAARQRRLLWAGAGFVIAAQISGCGPDTLAAAGGGAAGEAAAAKRAKQQQAQLESQIRNLQVEEKKRVDGIDEQVDRGAK